jgi:glycosyltransferase involved in cell wall biosynthesis
MTYSVVIPLFNESRNISELYRRIKNVLDGLGKQYEIVIVDDGSTDDSFELLKQIALKDDLVKIVRFDRNYGQHRAITAGVRTLRKR